MASADLESQIVKEVNKLRANPKSFIPQIERIQQTYKHADRVVKACESAIELLRDCKKAKAVDVNPALSLACWDQVQHVAGHRRLGHVGSDKSLVWHRVGRYAESTSTELCELLGQTQDPRLLVALWVIDWTVVTRLHRTSLLSPSIEDIGVAVLSVPARKETIGADQGQDDDDDSYDSYSYSSSDDDSSSSASTSSGSLSDARAHLARVARKPPSDIVLPGRSLPGTPQSEFYIVAILGGEGTVPLSDAEEKVLALQDRARPTVDRYGREVAKHTSGLLKTPRFTGKKGALKTPWEVHHDSKGKRFFYHRQSMKITYRQPRSALPKRVSHREWCRFKDKNGKTYYWCPHTGKAVPKVEKKGKKNVTIVKADTSGSRDHALPPKRGIKVRKAAADKLLGSKSRKKREKERKKNKKSKRGGSSSSDSSDEASPSSSDGESTGPLWKLPPKREMDEKVEGLSSSDDIATVSVSTDDASTADSSFDTSDDDSSSADSSSDSESSS